MMKTTLLFVSLFIAFSSFSQKIVLLKDGKTDYSIKLNKDQGYAREAAFVFKNYFKQISDVELQFDDINSRKKHIIQFKLVEEKNNLLVQKEDGFAILTSEENITFLAKNSKGFQNAVYTFLEKYLDCRYYATDEVQIPKKKNIVLDDIVDVQNPTFDFRVINYYEPYQEEYGRWHKLDNSPRKDGVNNGVSEEWGMWVHTMYRLVSPETYFATHPEYFAERNGIRIKDQLCLSNADVLHITIESLKKEIEKNPKARYWSVSQMDNYSYCQCEKCKKIDTEEGTPSGSIIRFVNEVAKQFPDKVISTLAYQYSRQVPKVTKPLPNVNIMLCSIECERAKPIEAYKGEGSFTNDIESWAKVSNNILVWDYLINFHHLIGIFPNFQVLQPNIQLFAKNKTTMLFEQGYTGKHGELNELRSYILAKLMWNSNANVDSLTSDFLKGYYGNAAPYIQEYLDLCKSELIKSGQSLGTGPLSAYSKGYLSPNMLDLYFSTLSKAKDAVAGNEKLSLRVEYIYESVRYAWLEVCKEMPFTDDWIFEKDKTGNYVIKQKAVENLKIFSDFAKISGPVLLHETRLSPSDYEKMMTGYFNNGISKHKAVNAKVEYIIPCSPKYAARGNSSLVDGVHGTNNYFALWQGWDGVNCELIIDLGKTDTIIKVNVSCLGNSQSWIFLPEFIEIQVSTDNKNWESGGKIINDEAGKVVEDKIQKFEIENLQKGKKYQYIKVKIKNIGKLPSFRGENGMAWLFVDEIDVE